jgi:hypothetical protein
MSLFCPDEQDRQQKKMDVEMQLYVHDFVR